VRGPRPLTAALRDERVLALLWQAAVAALLVALVAYGTLGVLADMRAKNLVPGLGFLDQVAGFGIAEGPAYDETDTYARAFVVGLANTVRVSVAGIALATVVGLVAALSRLSGNPLAAGLAGAYIDVFRNTPLLVQLIFWYRGVVLRLPSVGDSIVVDGPAGPVAYLSQRGLAIPEAIAGAALRPWLAVVLVGGVAGWGVRRWRLREQARTGQPARGAALGMATWAAIAVGAWALAPGAPLRLDAPAMGRFGYASGTILSPEFAALLVGLTAYTGAFIAEVIRSGIQSVTRGQREAALAQGLSEAQVLRLVVLPQALRVIVPPLTSQYLNLTKNSSLALYIGYPDLFNVGNTIGNQTGQFVVVTMMIMAIYLGISVLTSVLMNAYNRRIRLVER